MIAILLLSALLSLSWWLGILQMLAAGWPWFSMFAFVLVRLLSKHTAFYWADLALETVLDMAADAPSTFVERLRERENRRIAPHA